MISLKGFTRYDFVDIEFPETVNLFVGPNASGKTSIKDAIHYALTGHCARTDGGGKGAENMIREGERKAEIDISLGMYNIHRDIPGGLSVDGFEGNSREQQQKLYAALGVSREVLDAVLDTESMVYGKGKDIKNLLFKLVGISFERDDLIDIILRTVPTAIKGTVINLFKDTPNTMFDGTAQTFTNLYNQFYASRRESKRQLADIGDVGEAPETKGPSIEEVKKAISRKKREAEVINEELSGIKSAGGKREHIEAEIKRLKEQLKDAKGSKKSPQTEYKEVTKQIQEISSEIDSVKTQVSETKKAISALKQSGEMRCPIAPDAIQCPIEGSDRKNMVKELQNVEKELSGKIPELQAELKKARAKEWRLGQKLNEPDPDEIKAEIERLKDQIPAGSDKTRQAELEQTLKEFNTEVSRLEESLVEASKIAGGQEAVKEKKELKQRLDGEVKALEWLVKTLGPDGIPAKLLDDAIGPVEEEANNRLAQLTDERYEMHIEVEPDFVILITHDGVTTDVQRLSSSERLRLGIILQDAIARLAGTRLLVIDNADLLDADNRKMLMSLLLTIKEDYDTVIVLATKAVKDVKNPHLDDLAVFELIDGKPVEVE